MPFEIGNRLGEKQRYVADAIRRSVIQDDGAKLRRMVETMLDLAGDGDVSAAVFIRDSLDGRPQTSDDKQGLSIHITIANPLENQGLTYDSATVVEQLAQPAQAMIEAPGGVSSDGGVG